MRSKKLKLKKIYVALGLLLILFISWVAYSKVLVIKNINWQFNKIGCVTETDLNKNIKLKGQLLFKVDQKELEQVLKSDYPCIKYINLDKNLFGSTKITLNGREPFIRVISYQSISKISLDNSESSPSSESALVDYSVPSSSEQPFLVDEEGIIYKQADGNYPVLFWEGTQFNLGQKIDPTVWNELRSIIDIIIQLKQQNLITTTSTQLTLKKQADNLIVFSSPNLLFNLSSSFNSRDILNSLTSLQLILKTAKINNKTINVVDLRFDKPVVVYNSPTQSPL